MKVLVIGSGGREHALAWKIKQSPLVKQLYVAPGNPGTAALGRNVPISAESIKELAAFATTESIDLTVVGPEQPLALGIVDYFEQQGLACFGPTRRAAQIETSKAWCKDVLAQAGAPTAAYRAFSDHSEARAYVAKAGRPIVIKADGLAAGKGVTIARTDKEAFAALDEAMVTRAFGEAGSRIIVEEFLEGEECSVLAICRSKSYCLLPSSQDHKTVFDHDEGPNTGGMGAYSPFPGFTASVESKVRDTIIEPVLWAMEKRGAPYTGVLYVGLMMTQEGPKVLEINARSGDPETQAVLPNMDADFVELALAALKGDPSSMTARAMGASACVVMASGGYPGSYKKGIPIEGIEDAQSMSGVQVFHAGTALSGKSLVTNGGRVLGVTACSDTIDSALKQVYAAVSKINFDGVHYRKDIGDRTGTKGMRI